MFMNMEVLSLTVSQENIELMTETNMQATASMDVIDNFAFINNVKHGFICITMLITYIESVLNTILRDDLKRTDDWLLQKMSIEDKFEIIYIFYRKDLAKLKESNEWGVFKNCKALRNTLIHYKTNELGYAGRSPQWRYGTMIISESFTKPKMQKLHDTIMKFISIFISELGLAINPTAEMIDSDGASDIVGYIYNP